NVETTGDPHGAFAECQNDYAIKVWQSRQLLEQPWHIFVFIGERRAACSDDKCVFWQVETFSAQGLVLGFENSCFDSRGNYFHSAASFGYRASGSNLGQPVTVCDHACSTISIRPQLPRMRSHCQKSVCRPFQNRT